MKKSSSVRTHHAHIGLISVLVCAFILTVQSPALSQTCPDTLWTRTFGGSGIDCAWGLQQTDDGGYVIVGYTESFGAGVRDVWLIKTDSLGNQQWNRTFGGYNYDQGYGVQQTNDGGYIIVGITASSGAGHYDVWLIKTDSLGNQQWDHTYGGSSRDLGICIDLTTDGGYVIAGETESYGAGSEDIWLIKTDSSGSQQWNRTFGGSAVDWAGGVQQTNDGGYIIAGFTTSSSPDSGDAWLIKTDASGYLQWDRTFGGSVDDNAYSVQQTPDGGYIIGGFTNSYGAGNYDFWLIKTDVSGDEQWNRVFGGSGEDLGYDAKQTADGGYIIGGFTSSFGAGSEDLWLFRTDASGNQLWSSTSGGSYEDRGYKVQQTSDGGFVAVGRTYSFGAGSHDMYLVRLAPEPVYVSGDVYGAWCADTVIVTGEVRIPPDSTLTICPGTKVLFQTYCKFIVDSNATLIAVGTETDSILFDELTSGTRWHGIRFINASDSCRLEYCHLTHGWASGSGEDQEGGGIFCITSNPKIQNCLIDSCVADGDGGGIHCYYSNPVIDSTTIHGNSAIGSGGGILCDWSNPTITNNTISGNTSGWNGGGICCWENTNPNISRNTLSGNSAGNLGGGIFCDHANPAICGNTIEGNSASNGGGIHCYNGSNATIDSCLISANTASGNGGGIYCLNSAPSIQNCQIDSCTAGGYGGGICSDYSSPEIRDCQIVRCVAGSSGGGITVGNGNSVFTIQDCRIDSCQGWGGGGIFVDTQTGIIDRCSLTGNSASNYGGGIRCTGSNSTISNNTISGNSAYDGGGIHCDNASNATIDSCHFYGNSASNNGGGICSNNSSPAIQNTVIDSCVASIRGGGIYCDNSSLTIQNSQILDCTSITYGGGGILCLNNSNPIINLCTFTGNSCGSVGSGNGGAINCSASNVNIFGCTINDNTAIGESGGGISILDCPNATIDSCYIYGNSASLYGGGIRYDNSTGTITDNVLSTNSAYDGGAIYCLNASNATTINGNIINGNTATVNGAGICCVSSNPTITDNTITANTGSWGGGIECSYSSPSIGGNTIDDNTANYGGGICCWNNSNAVIDSNTISGNSANNHGGGIYCENSSPQISRNDIAANLTGTNGGGIYCYNNSSPTIHDNTISNNTAYNGGGIRCYGGSYPIIRDNTFIGNSATNNGGGGIFYGLPSPPFSGNIFRENFANNEGGGAYFPPTECPDTIQFNEFSHNIALSRGGGIFLNSVSPTLQKNTIVYNASPSGGGLYCLSCNSGIINNIVWGNSAEQITASGSSPMVTYSDVQGGWSGTGNINGYPLFADTANVNYHLLEGSPCIDAGDPNPIYNDPDGTRADMGGYYYPQTNPQTINYAVSFDGINDYLQAPDSPSLDSPYSAFTLEAWVFVEQFPPGGGDYWDGLISKGTATGTGHRHYSLYLNYTRGLHLSHDKPGLASYVGTVSNPVLQLQNWCHVAVVSSNQNGGRHKYYVNGQPAGLAENLGFSNLISNNDPLFMGKTNEGSQWFLNGLLDEVRIWNIPKTLAEIRATMYHELVGTEAGLIGYWNFNEASGNIAYDNSPNGNNAIIYGGAQFVPSTAPIGTMTMALECSGGSGFTYDGVEPNVGGINTEFEFRVKYRDPEGDAPFDSTYPMLLIDTDGDSIAEMTELMFAMDTTASFQTGRTYRRFLTLPQSDSIQYKFFAIDATGDTAHAFEQVINWNRGPEIRALDLAIYADDIEFSQENPDTNQIFTITARVHNESWSTVNNVSVCFYAKPNNYWEGSTRDTSSYVLFAERMIYSISPWGDAEVTFDTSYSVMGFYPFKVRVDENNEIGEWNELNNEAIRPVIVGNYSVPGAIVLTSGVSAGNCYATIYGHAEYLGSVVENEVVAGALVTIALSGVDTVVLYTNSQGNFSRGYSLAPSPYYVDLTITDFTLTDSVAQTFEVDSCGSGGPPPQPCSSPHELSISLDPMQPDQNHQVVIQGTVWNFGETLEPHVYYQVQVNGATIFSQNTHIDSGGSVNFGPIYQTLDPISTTTISASVDPNNAIFECSEGNNYTYRRLYPCDLVVSYSNIGVQNPMANNGIANNFYVNLQNTGDFYFPAASGLVQYLLSDVLYSNEDCSLPEPHQSVQVLSSWTTQLQANVLKIVADPYLVVSESNEFNNQDSIVMPTDLYFGRASGFPSVVQLGSTVNIPVSVYNSGAMDAVNAAILFEDIFRPTGEEAVIDTNYVTVTNHRRSSTQAISSSVSKQYNAEGWVVIRITADPWNHVVEYNESNNVWVDSFQVMQVLRPDLRILSQHINLSDLNPEIGDPVQIVATIYNVGDVQTFDSAQVVFGIDDEIIGDTLSLPPLTIWSGGHSYHTLQASEDWIAWNPDSAYMHVAKAWVDPWNLIVENNELNNYATRSLIVGSAPDLYVETMDIQFDPIYPHPGDSVTVSVTVHNSGGDAGSGVLKLSCSSYGWSARDSVVVVPFGGYETLEYLLPTPIGGDWTATVHAEIDSVQPYEFDEGNNSANREIQLARPLIFPLQTSLNFQFVNPLDSSALTLSVVNAGYDSTLIVDSITVDDPHYSIILGDTGAVNGENDMSGSEGSRLLTESGNNVWDDVDEPGFSLEVGQIKDVIVAFEPDTLGTFPANLRFYSNDPISPLKIVALAGIGSGPVINAEGIPDSIDFGVIPINAPAAFLVSITNEWYGTLDVALSMTSGDSVFWLYPTEGHLIHDQTLNSYLWFMPDTLGSHRDTLRILCNAYNDTLFHIPVVGEDTMFVISDFQVSFVGNDVQLSWEPIRTGWDQYLPWVDAYTLYHSAEASGPFTLLTALGPADSTYSHLDPDPSNRHFYYMTYQSSSVLSGFRQSIREGRAGQHQLDQVTGRIDITIQNPDNLESKR